MDRSDEKFILLNHARDELRQHLAVDAGLEPMDARVLESDIREIDEANRANCRETMNRCRDLAHEKLAGQISGSKVAVWREGENGQMLVAAPGWACDCFDGENGLCADRLYLKSDDWRTLLNELSSAQSRDYLDARRTFAEANRRIPAHRLVDVTRYRAVSAFTRDDPANIAPWWSVVQALAWIATRIPAYVEYIGKLEADEPEEHGRYIVHLICESQVAESDEGKAFMETRRAGWPDGAFLAHAGRDLLDKILAGEVRPMARQNDQGREMRTEEFVGIGARATGGDWLDLDPQPLFSSAEVIAAFPSDGGAIEAAPEAKREVQKKSPGRTKGTGYQRADEPLLAKMKEAIISDPSLNATSAAKLFADEAKGASWEAKWDRLAREFRRRAGKKGIKSQSR
ncbi:hypothetical protein [Qipengyuania sp.]|uniref:hypothetical protein n=1 Tax=Qipengyuania sp. TaxID=2004515 RepID=UPI003736A711